MIFTGVEGVQDGDGLQFSLPGTWWQPLQTSVVTMSFDFDTRDQLKRHMDTIAGAPLQHPGFRMLKRL